MKNGQVIKKEDLLEVADDALTDIYNALEGICSKCKNCGEVLLSTKETPEWITLYPARSVSRGAMRLGEVYPHIEKYLLLPGYEIEVRIRDHKSKKGK